MLGELVVILAILITVAFVYLKGTVVKAFLLLINTLVASTIAFAYFETLGRLIIGYGMVVQWGPVAGFVLIFVFALIILNVISDKLAPDDISFSNLADKLVSSLTAAFAGFVIAGVVLIAVAMAPIGTKLPYQRFNTGSKITSPEPDKSLILNADGFVTNFVSWLSQGSMSGKKSLAVFHPDLLNEIYLNQVACDKDNSPVAGGQAISVKAAWTPETELVSAPDNQPINTASGKKIVVVRTAISSRDIKDGGAMPAKVATTMAFTMSQIRLVCKDSDSAGSLDGIGYAVWPVGYIKGENTVDKKDLSEKITLTQLDLVFYIPADTVPVMLQFKQNAVDSVGKLVTGEKIPPPLELPKT